MALLILILLGFGLAFFLTCMFIAACFGSLVNTTTEIVDDNLQRRRATRSPARTPDVPATPRVPEAWELYDPANWQRPPRH